MVAKENQVGDGDVRRWLYRSEGWARVGATEGKALYLPLVLVPLVVPLGTPNTRSRPFRIVYTQAGAYRISYV